MIKLLDRQMIRGFFKAYVVCVVSLLSLYVVVDLFTNLDDFTNRGRPLPEVLRHIAGYYGIKVFQIFDRLCEAIVLLSAMFTVTWMQRNNEQMPYLSAGVSTHRIIAPVLACACVMLSLAVLNQELVLPRFADRLMFEKDDPGGEKEMMVKGAYEPNNIVVLGEKATRKNLLVRKFECIIPDSVAGNMIHIQAREAYYTPHGPRQGTWELLGTQPAELEPIADILEVIDSGRCLLHTRDVDFETLTRNANWYQLASTLRLYEELQKQDSARQPMVLTQMAVLFHVRTTRPLLGLLLVFLGLSNVLRDQNRNVILSVGSCLLLCGVFFIVCYLCKMLGESAILGPGLAAWAPILGFGPFALVLFDAIHT
jgi:lipopolysaccharide export system permease protein